MPTKLLFLDRDGTLIREPEDAQIDALEKLSFMPGVITNMHRVATTLNFKLVMVTNQDGLGTDSFPEDTFWPAHNKMLEIFAGEGIAFDEVHIDRSFPEDNAPTRKPGTGLLEEYINNPEYDLANSFVVGDRHTDVELAQNLGCRSILYGGKVSDEADFMASEWNQVFTILAGEDRVGTVNRRTRETHIDIRLNLDGKGKADIDTGLGFYDHMLEQIARHGQMDLSVEVDGDLYVDEHHTIEDTALAMGEAFKQALGNKKGIGRYGFAVPMDDSLAHVAVDFSGRAWVEWKASFHREKIGDMPTEMFYHFFKSFSETAGCNIHIKAEGKNEHHKIESIFKAFARALNMAVRRDLSSADVPSTKGVL